MKSKEIGDNGLQVCTIIPELYIKVAYMRSGSSGEHSKAIKQEYRIQSSTLLSHKVSLML